MNEDAFAVLAEIVLRNEARKQVVACHARITACPMNEHAMSACRDIDMIVDVLTGTLPGTEDREP